MGSVKISKRFEGWLDLVGWDYNALAKASGNYDPAFISAVIKGTKEPTFPLMKKWMDLTKMGFDLFQYDHNGKGDK